MIPNPQKHSLNENLNPVNPWLARIIYIYHNLRGESYYRERYEEACEKDDNLSWQDFLNRSFLEEFLYHNPILKKPVALVDFSYETKDILYWAGVDSLYDLLQITEEELNTLCVNNEQAKKEIATYLPTIGEELQKYSGNTTKLSLAYGYWTIPSPGASHVFNTARPTTRKEWFNEYYKLKEYIEGEEQLRRKLNEVRSGSEEDMPNVFKEFFQAIYTLFKAYDSICTSQSIKPLFFRPDDLPCETKDLQSFPNKRFLSLKELALLAIIDIFERTRLFKHHTVGEYLSATDEEMLDMAEEEYEDEDFQLLLITHSEIRLDFEIILDTIKTLASTSEAPKVQQEVEGNHERHALNEKLDPVNPWLAEAIREVRAKYPDDYLRKRYVSYNQDYPEREADWVAFLEEFALLNKTSKE